MYIGIFPPLFFFFFLYATFVDAKVIVYLADMLSVV